MPSFAYKALSGSKVTIGSLEAPDRRAALLHLKQKGLTPLELGGGAAAPAAFAPRRSFRLFPPRVGRRDITGLARQLATLLDSGLPLARALDFLQAQAANPALAGLLRDLAARLKAGEALSTAAAAYPHFFDSLFVSMVRAGEAGGIMDRAMAGLAAMRESQEALTSKVKGALAYPAIMFLAMVGAVAVMMVFMVPRFAGMFESMGQALPLPTQILVDLSRLVQQGWWLAPLAAGGAWLALSRLGRTPAGRARLDGAKLRLPLLGPALRKVAMARLCRTLGSLLASGVPLLTALAASSGVAGNAAVSQALDAAQKEVREGRRFGDTCRASGMFPAYVTEMVSLGEESGTLDRMLAKVADHYELEVDQQVKALTSLLEPVMILFMGGVVGFIVMAMLLPIFQMNLMAGG